MVIYVVQEGDTISSIANAYGVSETRLILDNGITNPNNLVTGQTIVITYPKETYIVKTGDTLSSIAEYYGITLQQLYGFNSFLWDRQYIYPGDILVISYDTKASITTNAYAFPYINKNTLKRALPNLTYLSILNYKTLRRGEIESFYDDSELVEIAKQFGVAPLMLVTSVTFRGERNPEMIYEILLNPDYQETHAQSMLRVLKEKEYYGVNITITFLNETNQELYLNYLKRITTHLNKEGYPVFITIDPNFTIEDNQVTYEKVDYTKYEELIDQAYLMRFYWGTQYGPPMPVSSMENIESYLDYMKQMINPKKISIGFPLLGYDWTLPYIQGFSQANAITLDSAIELARLTKSTIFFDEVSKTPYFEYTVETSDRVIKHVVWFVDARTISELLYLVLEDNLEGTGVWNIMSYDPQLWLITNSLCEIEKVLPIV